MSDGKIKVVGGKGKDEVEKPASETLAALIAKDKEERRQRAIAKIQKALEEERCNMVPVAIISAGNVTTRVEITPVD